MKRKQKLRHRKNFTWSWRIYLIGSMEFFRTAFWFINFNNSKLNEKIISILGSTGSIGKQTLKIIEKKILILMYIAFSKQNYKEINKQIIKFKPKYFLISNYEIYEKLK